MIIIIFYPSELINQISTMNPNTQLLIRNANKEQVQLFIQWGLKEDWNQGAHDSSIFFEADPSGFFVGEVNGIIVTTISAVRYPNNTGFISFYITKPEHRGKGFGKKIFNHAMQYLEGANIALDGDTKICHLYEKWGFKRYFKTLVYEGMTNLPDIEDVNIVQIKDVPLQTIYEYEKKVSPYQRDQFLKKYLDTPQSFAVGYYEQGLLKGYGLIRKIYHKQRIGPLYGDTPEIADKLLRRLVNHQKQKTNIVISIHDKNEKALQICERCGLKVCYQAERMFTGDVPDIEYDKIYSILSPDIG